MSSFGLGSVRKELSCYLYASSHAGAYPVALAPLGPLYRPEQIGFGLQVHVVRLMDAPHAGARSVGVRCRVHQV